MKVFLDKIEEWVGGTLFIVMLLALVFQVFSRQVFNSPLKWSEEFARLLFVYVGYLGVSVAIKENQHVYIDFFIKKFPKPIQYTVNAILQLLVLIVLVLMCYVGYVMTIRKIPVQIVSLNISYAYMYGALPVISLLMIYRHIQRNYICFKEWRQRS